MQSDIEKRDSLERVSFIDQQVLQREAEKTFAFQKERIKKILPQADVQHVGSTAIPNSLTKGDLDIQVRVSDFLFNDAVKALGDIYEANDGSIKTKDFRAFKEDTVTPPLGIQLTVIGSEFDFFWKFRDVLLQNDYYRKKYDELKRRFEGKSMDAYREAKDDFFIMIKQTTEFEKLKDSVDN